MSMLTLRSLDLGLRIYHGALSIVGTFHPKAKAITVGQRAALDQIKDWRNNNADAEVLWVHVASLGEFEQGRPVMELFKVQFPSAKIVLTFYSPSGYEVRKNYAGADLITYLPLDTRKNMEEWCHMLRPKVMGLVKYEVWPQMLMALGRMNVPVVMFSAVFYSKQRFFGRFSGFWKTILQNVSVFHVQDEDSAHLLRSIGLRAIEVSGDTRYDRVVEVASKAIVPARYLDWKRENSVVVLGSSYAAEEETILECIEEFPDVKWVIAPHHIDEENVQRIERLFDSKTQRATQVGPLQALPILILNTMGELGGLYKLGEIAIVGGGWGKGIHNILEPAAHGCAVIWGPNSEKFVEARLMYAQGGGRQVQHLSELSEQIREWLRQPHQREEIGKAAVELVQSRAGASAKVLKTIGEFWERKKR